MRVSPHILIFTFLSSLSRIHLAGLRYSRVVVRGSMSSSTSEGSICSQPAGCRFLILGALCDNKKISYSTYDNFLLGYNESTTMSKKQL